MKAGRLQHLTEVQERSRGGWGKARRDAMGIVFCYKRVRNIPLVFISVLKSSERNNFKTTPHRSVLHIYVKQPTNFSYDNKLSHRSNKFFRHLQNININKTL